MNAFTKNQTVRGKVSGRFVVVKSEVKPHVGEVLTVKEISPEGYVSTKTMRFPAEMMIAE